MGTCSQSVAGVLPKSSTGATVSHRCLYSLVPCTESQALYWPNPFDSRRARVHRERHGILNRLKTRSIGRPMKKEVSEDNENLNEEAFEVLKHVIADENKQQLPLPVIEPEKVKVHYKPPRIKKEDLDEENRVGDPDHISSEMNINGDFGGNHEGVEVIRNRNEDIDNLTIGAFGEIEKPAWNEKTRSKFPYRLETHGIGRKKKNIVSEKNGKNDKLSELAIAILHKLVITDQNKQRKTLRVADPEEIETHLTLPGSVDKEDMGEENQVSDPEDIDSKMNVYSYFGVNKRSTWITNALGGKMAHHEKRSPMFKNNDANEEDGPNVGFKVISNEDTGNVMNIYKFFFENEIPPWPKRYEENKKNYKGTHSMKENEVENVERGPNEGVRTISTEDNDNHLYVYNIFEESRRHTRNKDAVSGKEERHEETRSMTENEEKYTQEDLKRVRQVIKPEDNYTLMNICCSFGENARPAQNEPPKTVQMESHFMTENEVEDAEKDFNEEDQVNSPENKDNLENANSFFVKNKSPEWDKKAVSEVTTSYKETQSMSKNNNRDETIDTNHALSKKENGKKAKNLIVNKTQYDMTRQQQDKKIDREYVSKEVPEPVENHNLLAKKTERHSISMWGLVDGGEGYVAKEKDNRKTNKTEDGQLNLTRQRDGLKWKTKNGPAESLITDSTRALDQRGDDQVEEIKRSEKRKAFKPKNFILFKGFCGDLNESKNLKSRKNEGDQKNAHIPIISNENLLHVLLNIQDASRLQKTNTIQELIIKQKVEALVSDLLKILQEQIGMQDLRNEVLKLHEQLRHETSNEYQETHDHWTSKIHKEKVSVQNLEDMISKSLFEEQKRTPAYWSKKQYASDHTKIKVSSFKTPINVKPSQGNGDTQEKQVENKAQSQGLDILMKTFGPQQLKHITDTSAGALEKGKARLTRQEPKDLHRSLGWKNWSNWSNWSGGLEKTGTHRP